MFKTAWTEELQIQGKGDKFNWVAGAYLENNREPNIDPRRNFVTLSCTNYDTQACTDIFGIGSISESRNKYDYDSKGLYGRLHNSWQKIEILKSIRHKNVIG